jgi:hypothetical protein
MNNDNKQQTVASDLHPFVYAALLGFAAWFVLAVWGFASDGYTDYLLAIVSGFMLIFVAIPATLWLMARRHQDPIEGDRASFRGWAAGEVDTWQDRVKGANAAVEVLLPMAAIAIGMTAFAIVLHFTA